MVTYLLPAVISNYIKPYWSKQHGAYITLIVSWLIAVFLSDYFSWIQLVILIFLLSSLNATELVVEALSRKTRLPKRKKIWLSVYLFVSVLLSGFLFFHIESLSYLLPVFTLFALVFIILAVKRKQKSVPAEWITFGLISLAGLLAYNPADLPPVGVFVVVGLLMSSYFGQSIFLVKARLDKLPNSSALIYSIFVITITFLLLGIDMFTSMLSVVLIVKSMQTILWNDWYSKLRIKWIGMIELGYHIVFLLLMTYFSNTVLHYHEAFWRHNQT